jgi:hypothetical protein
MAVSINPTTGTPVPSAPEQQRPHDDPGHPAPRLWRVRGQHAGGGAAQDALAEQVRQRARRDAAEHDRLAHRHREPHRVGQVEQHEHRGCQHPQDRLHRDEPQRAEQHHPPLPALLGVRLAGAHAEPAPAPQQPDRHRHQQVQPERETVQHPHPARIRERALRQHPGGEHEHHGGTAHVREHHDNGERDPGGPVDDPPPAPPEVRHYQQV